MTRNGREERPLPGQQVHENAERRGEGQRNMTQLIGRKVINTLWKRERERHQRSKSHVDILLSSHYCVDSQFTRRAPGCNLVYSVTLKHNMAHMSVRICACKRVSKRLWMLACVIVSLLASRNLRMQAFDKAIVIADKRAVPLVRMRASFLAFIFRVWNCDSCNLAWMPEWLPSVEV
jgi:hypothetical protein